MHPVRKSILEFLKRKGHATVGELAAQLEMAPVSVRHHLDLLISDNLVCTPRVRRSSGAGRPKQVYALTPAAAAHFPNNYRNLADDSLLALKRLLSPEQVQQVMEEMAARTVEHAPDHLDTLPLAERVAVAAQFLTAQGYMAEFEVGEEQIVLHTCNCPYAQLASPHQELCHMDMTLMCKLTGIESQRMSHIADGDGRCSYLIQLDSGIAADSSPVINLLATPANV